MANKVVVFTMMVEIADDSGHPDNLDWCDMMEQNPGVVGFNLIKTEDRPYESMEDDPLSNTQH